MRTLYVDYPLKIFEINYDELTENFETETRSMLDKINLPWDTKCLTPHLNQRSVRTASQQQVRRKVYKGSSKVWKNYQEMLKPKFDQYFENLSL